MVNDVILEKLPTYTDIRLNAGQVYTTLDLNDQYYERNSVVELVNDRSQVIGLGKIVSTRDAKFDYLDYSDLKEFANPDLSYWADTFDYMSNRFGDTFVPQGTVQLIKFEVTGSMKFDDVKDVENEE